MPSVRPKALEQDQGPKKIKFPREALSSKSPKEIPKASQNRSKRCLEALREASEELLE